MQQVRCLAFTLDRPGVRANGKFRFNRLDQIEALLCAARPRRRANRDGRRAICTR